jgi:hypothetical protein
MAVQVRCDRCGQRSSEYTTVQTNYNLSRHPKYVRICAACSARAEAQEAPRRLVRQMDEVVTYDAAAAGLGMSVAQRDQLFRSGGFADAFETLLIEVA